MAKPHENKEAETFPHPLHEHQLSLQAAKGPYKCNGCKLPGFTRCFKCPKAVCDFYLHTACFYAHTLDPLTEIKFMETCEFVYHDSPPRVADKYCDACGLDILGLRYECSTHGSHDLHPTCANISLESCEMERKGLKLELRDKVESKCLHCKQRYPAEECVGFTGWKWVSEERYYGFPYCFSGRKVCFHVKCMNEIMAPK